MRDKHKLETLTQIAKIRDLQESQARSRLLEAVQHEETCLQESQKSQDVLENHVQAWNEFINSSAFLPEYTAHFSDNLNRATVDTEAAEEDYSLARETRNESHDNWQISRARISQMAVTRKKVQRKSLRLSEEAAQQQLENRISYVWSQR